MMTGLFPEVFSLQNESLQRESLTLCLDQQSLLPHPECNLSKALCPNQWQISGNVSVSTMHNNVPFILAETDVLEKCQQIADCHGEHCQGNNLVLL